jgi:hypothetical protein
LEGGRRPGREEAAVRPFDTEWDVQRLEAERYRERAAWLGRIGFRPARVRLPWARLPRLIRGAARSRRGTAITINTPEGAEP